LETASPDRLRGVQWLRYRMVAKALSSRARQAVGREQSEIIGRIQEDKAWSNSKVIICSTPPR
jgi:hypothetical protein